MAPVKVSNVPICAMVTGIESEPLTVYVPVSVYVVALVVCANAAAWRINPPPAVTISPVKTVSVEDGAVAVAVNAM